MRLLAEIALVALLIAVGWTTPYKYRVVNPPPSPPPVVIEKIKTVEVVRNVPAAAVKPTPDSGDWMWQHRHGNVLDAPVHKTGQEGASPHPY